MRITRNDAPSRTLQQLHVGDVFVPVMAIHPNDAYLVVTQDVDPARGMRVVSLATGTVTVCKPEEAVHLVRDATFSGSW